MVCVTEDLGPGDKPHLLWLLWLLCLGDPGTEGIHIDVSQSPVTPHPLAVGPYNTPALAIPGYATPDLSRHQGDATVSATCMWRPMVTSIQPLSHVMATVGGRQWEGKNTYKYLELVQ